MTTAWAAIALIALARIVYQVWFSPYELVADEAQYWDWSRRLSASYYSKGPGTAWLIALSTSVFGVSEWAVRLPATLAFVVTSAFVSRLAVDFSSRPAVAARAAFVAALLVNLLPAYLLAALLMTIDAPYMACWAAAVGCAWWAYKRERSCHPSWLPWIGCGIGIGGGFLFKYTAVLLLPGLVAFAILNRDAWQRGVALRVTALLAIAVTLMLPVLLWNLQHQGAGLQHLLGFLATPGGDRPVRGAWTYDPRWTLELVLAQLAIIGPVFGVFALAWRRVRAGSDAAQFAVCCAAPMLLFFLFLTFRAPAEANWPIAAYISLLPLAACTIAEGADSGVRIWWRTTLAYGAVACLAIHMPLVVASLPTVGRLVPTHRFRGFADRARSLGQHLDSVASSTGRPLIVATSHNLAGLLAFYLPGRPLVASAGRFLGDRPSAYDYFADTSLAYPQIGARPAVLVGGTFAGWEEAFIADGLTLVSDEGPQFATSNLRGPRQPLAPVVHKQ